MEDNIRRTPADRPDTPNWEQREETFTLWDALELAFEENYPSDRLKSLLRAFSRLNVEMQVAALRRFGEKGRQLSDKQKRGVIYYFLAKHLEDARVEVRVAAVEAVGMLTRQDLTETLALKLVSDESTSVRVASAEALAALVESITLRSFEQSLSDPSWEVRAAAIQTLGKLGERLIIEPLQAALDDQDFSVRSAALHALGTFKGALSTKSLVSLAKEETNDWITRDAAVTALERAGDYPRIKALRASLDRALEREPGFMEPEKAGVSAQPSKKWLLLWSVGRGIVAYAWKQLRKYTGVVLSRSKEIPMVLPPLFLIIVGFFGAIARFYACKRLRKYGKLIFSHGQGVPAILLLSCLVIGGVGGSIVSSHASGIQETPSAKQSSTAASLPIPTMDITHGQDNAHLMVTAQPKSVGPGQTFSISVAATNDGSRKWTDTEDYRLVCSSDNTQKVGCMGIEEMSIKPSSVSQVDRTYTFVIPLTAPLSRGIYTSRWTMLHNGVSFGNSLDIHISVF
jgi:hypothetical protein